jgi:hypothetical protein
MNGILEGTFTFLEIDMISVSLELKTANLSREFDDGNPHNT